MKRLLFFTLIVVAFALLGILHGSYTQVDRVVDSSGGVAYSEVASENMPDVIFDANVLPPPLL